MTKINAPRQYRQGDIFLIEIPDVPSGLLEVKPEEGRLIVARGEATGHHHSFPHRQGATLFRDTGDGSAAPVYLRVTEPGAPWEHQEHSTIQIPPGNYRIVRQREYSPEEIRRVED